MWQWVSWRIAQKRSSGSDAKSKCFQRNLNSRSETIQIQVSKILITTITWETMMSENLRISVQFIFSSYRLDVRFSETAMREIVGNVEKNANSWSVFFHFRISLVISFALVSKLRWRSGEKPSSIVVLNRKRSHVAISRFFPLLSVDCKRADRRSPALQRECIFSGKRNIYPRSPRQLAYYKAMQKHDRHLVRSSGNGKNLFGDGDGARLSTQRNGSQDYFVSSSSRSGENSVYPETWWKKSIHICDRCMMPCTIW